jgi:hypothetical protein
MVSTDRTAGIGMTWAFVTHKVEDGKKVVYKLTKAGKKTARIKAGTMQEDGSILDDAGRKVGEYRAAGVFPEVAVWMYRQIAEVWKLDNEFAARWASFAFGEEHRDLKVVLSAFMLVQSRKGDPVMEEGKVAFHDEDYRDVGEAMVLLHKKGEKIHLRPKDLVRIHDVLTLPGVAELNRELGFGKSDRKAFLGRWDKAVEKWLQHREDNPKLLENLVKDGYRTTVMELARLTKYKPENPRFFDVLRWKQAQADDGRRQISIGKAVAAAESWEGMTEQQICELIIREKPGFKRIVSLVPQAVGVTRAVMAASIESGALSDKDLVIATPTLEDLGLLDDKDVRARWEKAISAAEDQRASNIARNVKSKDAKEKLQEASDVAVQKAVEEVVRNIRVYFFVDTSGSMEPALAAAKQHIAKFLQGFPPDQVHVATFSTAGREISIPHPSAAGVENAFKGIRASGGTDYGSGVLCLQGRRPKADEDVLFIFIGDEQQTGTFEHAVRVTNLSPMAFGFVKVVGTDGTHRRAVQDTAVNLGVPCFMIDERTFSDPYAIPRTIRALVSATPVNRVAAQAVPRVTLVDKILKTDLLRKPAWAA